MEKPTPIKDYTLPPNEEIARKMLLKDIEFTNIRWLLEVANQEYQGRTWELRDEIDTDNAVNRWHYPKKNLMELREIWN